VLKFNTAAMENSFISKDQFIHIRLPAQAVELDEAASHYTFCRGLIAGTGWEM